MKLVPLRGEFRLKSVLLVDKLSRHDIILELQLCLKLYWFRWLIDLVISPVYEWLWNDFLNFLNSSFLFRRKNICLSDNFSMGLDLIRVDNGSLDEVGESK